MNFRETMEWIGQANMRGISLGLDRMTKLCSLLGNPQEDLRIIHVAGTNGKGSVCTMIAEALKEAGWKVGRYISPTVFDYRERIQINNVMISETDLAAIMTQVRIALEKMAAEGIEVPTAFEIETAAAFLYFKEKQSDYVVLEVGMGGRLDSTNIIRHPVITVITSIAMDHMQMLGDTLTAITEEKAGIIKNGVPVVTMLQNKTSMSVIEAQAEKNNSTIYIADPSDVCVLDRKVTKKDGKIVTVQHFHYKTIRDIRLYLGGTYQIKNAALAIEVLMCLPPEVFKKKKLSACVIQGFSKASWPGRFECIHNDPQIWIDGAHNPDGASALTESVNTYFPDRSKVVVMGVFADKDYIEILKRVSTFSNTIVTFKPENKRGLWANLLAECAEPYFDKVIAANSASEAIVLASKLVKKDGIIIVLGSLSTVMTMHAICDIL